MNSNAQEPKKPVVYAQPSKLKGGEIFSGVYTGTVEKEDPFNEGKMRSTHYIEDVDTVYGINGTAQLNGIMKNKEKGDRLDVEYVGKVPFKRKNGKTVNAHEWNVQSN